MRSRNTAWNMTHVNQEDSLWFMMIGLFLVVGVAEGISLLAFKRVVTQRLQEEREVIERLETVITSMNATLNDSYGCSQ